MAEDSRVREAQTVHADNRHIMAGFVVVVLLLFCAALFSWYSLSNLFRSVDRYATAGLLIMLNRTRLHELIFTRDSAAARGANWRSAASSLSQLSFCWRG